VDLLRGRGRLQAPVILIWDNLNTHVSAAMRTFTDAHRDWLTVVRLPAYAPDLNLAAPDVGQLADVVRNRLKTIQYRPALIDGFLAQTGLTLEPEPPVARYPW
jgi:putative transposase